MWRDFTSAAALTPRAAPRATLPSQPALPRGEEEGPLPWRDQRAAVAVVVENLSPLGAAVIWPRTGLVAGFPPS